MRQKWIKRLSAYAAATTIAVFSAVGVRAEDGAIATTDFLSDGVSARAFAIGNAFAGIVDDESAVYWNPAGLHLIKSPVFSTTRATKSEFELTTQSFGLAAPYAKGVIGFNLVYSSMGNVIVTTLDSNTGRLVPSGIIGEDDLAYSLSYGWQMKDNIGVGVALKNARQAVGGYSASGFGFDAGAIMQFDKNTRASLTLQNVGDMEIGKDTIPFNIKLAGSYKLMEDKLTLAASYDTAYLDTAFFSLGGEYRFNDNFTGRAGTTDGNLSFGLGVSYEEFRFDYSFMNDDDTGDRSVLSVNYLMPVKSPKKQSVEPSAKKPATEPKKDVTEKPAKKTVEKTAKDEAASEVSTAEDTPEPEPKKKKTPPPPKKDESKTAKVAQEEPKPEPKQDEVQTIGRKSSLTTSDGSVKANVPAPRQEGQYTLVPDQPLTAPSTIPAYKPPATPASAPAPAAKQQEGMFQMGD